MNDEQRVDIKLGERTFSFSIPADEFIPFGKAKKKIEKLLEEINVPEEKLPDEPPRFPLESYTALLERVKLKVSPLSTEPS